MALASVKNVERGAAIELADAYLAERGVLRDSTSHDYLDEDVIDAIRARGWEPKLRRGESGEWEVVVQAQSDPTAPAIEMVGDHDRTRALLRTLAIVVTWLTPDEHRARFDAAARRFTNLSGEEFLKQVERGELARDDPRVVHVLMLRPDGE